MKKGKVYINGRLIGFHPDPKELTGDLIGQRRKAQISPQVSIAYHDDTNEVYVNTDAGRVLRPLIVVEKGKPKLTNELIKEVEKGHLKWHDLVRKGVIEYLDSEEEENALVALNEEEVTSKHSHLELDGNILFSVIESMIPYLEHNLAGKNLHGAKMFKQGLGLNGINYNLRTDTEGHLLYYPEKQLVKTRISESLKTDDRPDSQNFIVAIMPFYGFNLMDAVVLNKGAVQRGLARSAYFRTYETEEQQYPGGQIDKFETPEEETVGYLGEEAYIHLGEDGLVEVESLVSDKEVIVGKTSPPRFLEEMNEFGIVKEKRRESSLSPRKGKPGFADKVIITEGANANKLVKIKIRSEMIPEVGDKFSSKHGQKGVVGALIPEEDMPFTIDGIKPDLILNPHAIPSRMTVGHLLEMLAGKTGSLKAEQIDGTPFIGTKEETLEKALKALGFRPDGKEVFYDGITGERIKGEIFTGVVAYRRLYHMVSHKMQARSRGPVQLLTRQPTEGKEKLGGLRFGEMEGETLVGHGAAMLLQEKFIYESDRTIELVCEKCGVIAINDQIRNRRYCPICQTSKVYPVEMSYGFKLLLDELIALGVYAKLNVGDKVD